MPRSYDDYSSDDDGIDVQVRHLAAGPRRGHTAPHYIQTTVREHQIARHPPRDYYQTGLALLQPERTMVRTHTRIRSRSRERRSSPPSRAPAPAPAPVPVAPVVIHNKIINEQSDSEDWSDDSHPRRHRRFSGGRSRAHSRVHSRASSSHSALEDARERWALELAQKELKELKLSNARDRDQRSLDKRLKEEAELQQAKRELDEIKRLEKAEADQKRMRKEFELKQLEEERTAAEAKAREEKVANEAIEKYKLREAERIAKEKMEKELAENEYQRRLQADLINAGVDEKDIAAILKKEKIKSEEKDGKKQEHHPPLHAVPHISLPPERPTYTRMSLRHLDVETLIYHKIDFDYDQEQPGHVIIKRWVPEWEQDMLWEHSRKSRIIEKKEDRVVLAIEGGKKQHRHHHHHRGEEFEWVRKKERRRSKSPGLLMYLAGGHPA